MKLFAVPMKRTVKGWFNSVNEVDACIDPLCFEGAYRKKVNTMGKIWKQKNNFGGLTDCRLKAKNILEIEDDDWSAFIFFFRKFTNSFSRELKESKFIKLLFQQTNILLVSGDEQKVSIQTVILQCGLCKE